MDDIKVRINYKNKQLVTVSQKTYSLDEYCAKIKSDLLYLVQQIEDVYFEKNEYNAIEMWGAKDFRSFQRIRHKLLDAANNIGRIPQNIVKE